MQETSGACEPVSGASDTIRPGTPKAPGAPGSDPTEAIAGTGPASDRTTPGHSPPEPIGGLLTGLDSLRCGRSRGERRRSPRTSASARALEKRKYPALEFRQNTKKIGR